MAMAILHFRCKERRRTVRVMLSIPLKVHGISTEGETFAVATKSHTVSLHGASLELEYPVQLGDILTVENESTQEQTEARVVTIKKTRESKVHVGLEFTDKDVNFWHMVFPVPGAKPMRRRFQDQQTVAVRG
jgi:PilZ domain